MTYSRTQLRVRESIVFGIIVLLFFFWLVPVGLLASLLSYEELKRVTPWLVRLLDKNDNVRALVQNTLPSTALMLFNGLLPFILESELCLKSYLRRVTDVLTCPTIIALSYVEGHKARSLIEYSLLKK